eukprot:TRINITY_DN44765_c0_g1_i1.p1 TRINITY_DN44765_c0_g1~~TRINITY_DN44765_c0_g1_i1.p1  ORF type:complete len:281 (-),score=47.32 TRINITY_DN44765_c0_g1_i1:79-921(-)
MALSKNALLSQLADWGIEHETIHHALSPTCEIHSENIKGTAFEKYVGNGQAKNLFFRVPSGGGKLKNRLFLVCALVETVVDNKALSSRLGIKPSAPLRFAPDDIFENVLQIPLGSVNPFVMAQSTCNEVTLLLDEKFLACDRLLFHPMQSDFTTALTPAQLTAFLEQAAPARYLYVDLGSSEPIKIPESSAATVAGTAAAAPTTKVKGASVGAGSGKSGGDLAIANAATVAAMSKGFGDTAGAVPCASVIEEFLVAASNHELRGRIAGYAHFAGRLPLPA